MKVKGIIQTGAIIVAVAIVLSNTSTTDIPEIYNWGNIDSYNDLYLKAKHNKQPLIVYFHVDWCKYCKTLNEVYLKNDKVYNLLSNIQMVQINPELSNRHKALAEQYKVTGYPKFFVTHPHTNKKKSVSPFRKGDQVWTIDKFIEKLNYAIEYTGK